MRKKNLLYRDPKNAICLWEMNKFNPQNLCKKPISGFTASNILELVIYDQSLGNLKFHIGTYGIHRAAMCRARNGKRVGFDIKRGLFIDGRPLSKDRQLPEEVLSLIRKEIQRWEENYTYAQEVQKFAEITDSICYNDSDDTPEYHAVITFKKYNIVPPILQNKEILIQAKELLPFVKKAQRTKLWTAKILETIKTKVFATIVYDHRRNNANYKRGPISDKIKDRFYIAIIQDGDVIAELQPTDSIMRQLFLLEQRKE